jgi:hypothetical protein
VRAFETFVHQVADVLRDNAKHRRLERTLHLVNRLDAGIQIFNEEGQTDPHDQADDNTENDVQCLVWFDGAVSRLGRAGNFHY